jgi:tetratricopeptide (TPR) repeat protein
MSPGDVIAGRFRIESLAGAGGMGEVFRAADLTTGEPVAIKVLRARDESALARFAREARLLDELRHPGLVRYISHGATPAGAPWLALEWLDGEDLAALLGRRGLAIEETLALATEVAGALAAAHGRGIVHRDVKPSNVFLAGGDPRRPKLLDFGIARASASTAAQRTQTGALLGTPGYVAPEQARGDRNVGPAADVFSLGCVLFECLTGQPPFSGDHVLAVLAKILLEDAPRASAVHDGIPPEIDALVASMMAKDPGARPADGAEVVERLGTLRPSRMRLTSDPPGPSPSSRPASLTGGEQRLLSVLLASDPDAGPAVALSLAPTCADDGSLAEVRAAARHHGARVERLADGSIVVVVTGSGAATDQAASAARCALAVRRLLPRAPMVLVTGRADLSARWPVGEAIERGVRLLAGSGGVAGIVLDDVTAGLIDGRFEVAGGSPGAITLRCERSAATHGARTLLGRATPCVGRDRELAALIATYDEVVEEPCARMVLITAEAGVGKSRLRHELIARLLERGDRPAVLTGRGDPTSAGAPFALVARALRSAAGIGADEPPAVQREKLRSLATRSLAADADPGRIVEFLGELGGAGGDRADPSPQLGAARADPILMGDQLRRAWEDWLDAESSAGPIVLVLEDVQWGDLPSLRFVESALRHLRERPLLVLALARPEAHRTFPDLARQVAMQVDLRELSRRASERLVRSVLGDDADAATVDRIVTQAAGNAFYLEELLRAVAAGASATTASTAPGTTDSLPGTVMAMVHARLEALEPEARRVLRAASVLGQTFAPAGLGALLGSDLTPERITTHLAELVDREILIRRGSEHAFRHAALREAAYATLTSSDCTLGHRLAAEHLAQRAVTGADAFAVAEHLERARAERRAAGWYLRAAEAALEGNDFESACLRAERGVACGPDDELRGLLRRRQAEACVWRGEAARTREYAQEALDLLPRGSEAWSSTAGAAALACGRLGDTMLLGTVAAELANALEHAGSRPSDDSGGGAAAGNTEGSAAQEAGAVLAAACRATHVLFHVGRTQQGEVLLALIEDAVRRIECDLDPVYARLCATRATHALFRGDTVAYLEMQERAAEHADRAGDIRAACQARGNAGYAAMELGDYCAAERGLRATIATADRMGLRTVAAAARHNLGLVLLRLGALDEALEVERDAVASYEALGDAKMEGAGRIYLATILDAAGDPEGAEREAREAVRETEGAPVHHLALATLAAVLLARGHAADALEHARDAVRALEATGHIEEGAALVGLVHAEALLATGHRGAARAAIEAVRDRLVRRAHSIRDAHRRESFLHSVPENARILALARDWL